MIRKLLICLGLVAALPASAQSVMVSASDKDGVTEVVLEFDDRPEFETRRRESGYSLQFTSPAPIRFDLSEALLKIDRMRVADIRATGNNRVEIDLACQCNAQFTEVGDTALVVAIREENGPPPHAQTSTPVMPGISVDGLAPGGAPRMLERWVPPDAAPQLEPAKPARRSPSRVIGLLAATDSSASHGVAVELIGRALAKAAAEGNVATASDSSARGVPDTALAGGLAALDGQSNLSVQTAFDRVFGRGAWNVPPTDQGVTCLSDNMIDVASWGDNTGAAELGRMRGRAIAEDGSIAPDNVAELARFYIFLGFGREAQAAAAFMPQSEERNLIEALGDIMDDGFSDDEFLHPQVQCDGAVALWALLAKPIGALDAPKSDQALLLAFSALPPHLRTHLGPLLSERLHDAGLGEAAHVAINAVTRTGTQTDESELATARLELDGTHAPAARETLERISNGTDLTAASALLELLRDAEDRGMAPNPAWVEDAPTLVAALEGTEVAEELNLAGLRGLVALGHFDSFRAAVVADEPGLNEKSRQTLSKIALKAAIDTADDATFLQTEIGLSALLSPAQIDRDTKLRLAQRLLALGLAGRAIRYVEVAPETEDARRITADILTRNGRIGEAVALLSSQSGPDELRLLAAAHAAAGQQENALAALAAAGADDEATTAALRAANWTWVADNAEAEIAGAARGLTTGRMAMKPDDERPNGALIDAIRNRRDQAEALLNATRPSEGASPFTN